MTATRLLELFWEYGQPRIGRVGPKGYERRGEQRGNIRFYAWLRVVTMPEYPYFEKALKFGDWEAFLPILEVSLKMMPFKMPESTEGDPGIAKAFIPVSAAMIFAQVSKTTIFKWIDKGLPHEKRGQYYWVHVPGLEQFYRRKRTEVKRERKKAYKEAA